MQTLYTQYKQQLTPLYTAHEASLIFRACVAHVLQIDEQKTYFLSDLPYTQAHISRLQAMLEQLKTNTPLQYVLGYESFMGLKFAVTPDVLIPRPETEQLVNHILTENKERESLRILDVGTGSGCMAISLANYLKNAQVMAIDVSEKALAVAQKNAHSIGVDVQFCHLDFLKDANQITSQKFDMLVSNPPYIMQCEKDQMQANVLDYEPHTALFVPDNDPLLFYRAIADFADKTQTPAVYLEINRQFGAQTCALFEQRGYKTRLLMDDFENPRFVIALR